MLGDTAGLEPILAYLRDAAVAIALLERSRLQSPDPAPERFLAEQLVRHYREPDYLMQEWQRSFG